ncbi:hypothetical protein [Snuella lapsa]|uniref:DUF4136 domain-containing protein n=1 Tax=Snuella lapsa TaxID=870481 RepID=A0ABP6XKT7_9FLAO
MKTFKKHYRYLLIFILLLTFSCSPKLSSSFTKENYTGKAYSKIAVVGISKDLSSRLAFEKTAVDLLQKKGVNAIQGINIFPQNMSETEKQPSNIIKIIKENDLDGVITMGLIDTKDGHRYEQGGTYTIPAGYYRVGKHIYRRYITLEEPGYYVPSKSYVIEAVFYNLKRELVEGQDTWVWTGESSIVDPSSLQSAAKSFTSRMVGQIIKDGIIVSKHKQ